MKAAFNKLRKHYKKYGWHSTLTWMTQKICDRLNRKGWLTQRQWIEVIWLENPQLTNCLAGNEELEIRFLAAEEVRRYAEDLSHDLPAGIEQRIESGFDSCLAALDGNKLAAYSWYAFDSIEAEHNFDVWMSFPTNVAYMYKGFTLPAYRGRRLHGLLMGTGWKRLAEQGVEALVSTVDWTNAASLKSCRQLGYEFLGKIAIKGTGTKQQFHYPPCALAKGVTFGSIALAHSARKR